MTTEQKIEAIKDAVRRGIQRQSKLDAKALMVPGLMSLNIRHILNNLGAISTKYCEVGIHVGGSFCSTIYKNENLKEAVAIDCWLSDTTEGRDYQKQFEGNLLSCVTPGFPNVKIIKEDSFNVTLDWLPIGIDMYYFDGSHDEDSQRKALTYYLPVLADTFIFCVDDYMLPEVKKGTQDGIAESGCEILYENELITDHEYDNESFWRGWYIALLKKK
jgi:hypothetical protein